MNRVASCGTRSGAKRHRRAGESPCTECLRAEADHVASWSAAHPERAKEINARARAKYRSKPEVMERKRAAGRAYAKSDAGREAGLRSIHRRRAAKLNNGAERYTTQDVITTHGTDCHLCGEQIDFDVSGRPGYEPGWERGLNLDHVIPLARGGSDTLANVKPAHAICNIRKPFGKRLDT